MQSQKTILLIDDDYNELAITSAVLHEAGYRVLIAEDGEIGIHRALFAKPNLIILDAVMPGIDGYGVCQRLKSNRHTSNIPVMLKTCLGDELSILHAYKVGVDGYIIKNGAHNEALIDMVTDRLLQSPLDAAKCQLLELLNV